MGFRGLEPGVRDRRLMRRKDAVRRMMMKRIFILSEVGKDVRQIWDQLRKDYPRVRRSEFPTYEDIELWLSKYDKGEYHRRALRTLLVWRKAKEPKAKLEEIEEKSKAGKVAYKAMDQLLKWEKHEKELYALQELDSGLKGVSNNGVVVNICFPFDASGYPKSALLEGMEVIEGEVSDAGGDEG